MALPEIFHQVKHKEFKAIIHEFIALKEYKNIEIEARLGRIMNKICKRRIDFRTEHPIIFEQLANEFCFESGVDEKDYLKIKNLISGESLLTAISDKITIANRIRKIESLNNPENVSFERKEKIKSLDIFLPDFKYDVRISISSETVAQAKEFDGAKPLISRLRRRESLPAGPFVFDFTKVSSADAKNTKSYEVELEIKDFKDGLVDFSSIVFALPLMRAESYNRRTVKKN